MNRFILVVLLCITSGTAIAQGYYIKQYRVEKGLPSDIIKASAQDSLGYFWAATDEGLVKYDGINFTSYRKATRSNYSKGLFTTRQGKLLAFGDLDLVEIKNLGDTVIFKRLCPVSRVENDSSLTYPKLLFEDAKGNLWVSESQAVVKLNAEGKFIKRYSFDLKNRSPQFLRSFAFFEDQRQTLFITSFQGNVFRYNTPRDSFETFAENFPPHVEFVSVERNTLLIGSGDGLSEALLLPSGGFEKPVLKIKIPFISYVHKLADGKYFIATRGNQHYFFDPVKVITIPVLKSINNINHVYISREKDIWLSGNEGLLMMHENLFQRANDQVTDFIESITEDPASGMVYYAIATTLYAYNRNTKVNTHLLEIPDGYFQSLIYTEQGIWAANAFKVYLISTEGKIKKEFDFTAGRRFITTLTRDAAGNIWLAIPGSNDAYRIDQRYTLTRYPVPLGKEGVINVIREGKDGIYIASAGSKSYLFYMPASDSVFRNISLPLTLDMHTEFNATDLSVVGDKIWLATTEGLLKYDKKKIETINLGEHFVGLPVKSIFTHPGNKLLASTAYGMILYDIETGVHDLFNESSGLLSNTITPQGFFVGQNDRVWIGTANGLCYSIRPLTKLTVTSQPLFTRFVANGKNLNVKAGNEIQYGSFVSIQASSITFPENEVILQYRILPDQHWSTSEDAELQFSALEAGSHTLEVRAKKNGPFSWSNSAFLNFEVTRPYWQHGWFYIGLFAVALLLVAVTYTGVNARNLKRNRELQQLVDERTNEIRLRNEELQELNNEKNSLISIVAHDLKSPLKQILGILSLIKMTAKADEEMNEYLTMMETSTKRLDNMIIKILDVDAIDSKTLNLNMERLSFSNVIHAVADRFENDAAGKNILLVRSIASGVFVGADKNYFEQVLENLLSNAIKFSPFNRRIFIKLIVQDGKAICEIRDEGPGISESDQKKLFGKYQKLSAQPTGTETSTGLGLSIVKKFVLAMKGQIWCESKLGEGASFFVSFQQLSG